MSRERAAVATLERLGFHYGGGTEWRMPPSQDWLPIVTAPRVFRVLVTCEGYEEPVDIARQVHQGAGVWEWITDDNESAATGYFREGEPTLWMWLPVSPGKKQA